VLVVVREAKFFAGEQSPHGFDIVAGTLEIWVDQQRFIASGLGRAGGNLQVRVRMCVSVDPDK
jgi:hypothetical protein